MFPIGNPFADLWGFVTSPFESLVGWAGDKIFEGITNWIAKGCVQLLGFFWSVMDRTATPHLNAEWFSGTTNSPYQVAARIGGLVLLGLFFVSIAHGVATGDVPIQPPPTRPGDGHVRQHQRRLDHPGRQRHTTTTGPA